MRHLKVKNVFAVTALCLFWMGLGVSLAPAQDAGPNVARVSFV
jgi:hypothetical protein